MNKLYALLILFFAAGVVAAQDAQFSQYYQAPLYLNPGFTGITPGHRMVLNHRLQWPGLPQAFSTYAASYDMFLEKIRSGVGVQVMTDKMGSANWRSTTVQLLYSYKVPLNEKLVFSPGLSFGYGTNGLDRSKLRMGDGLAYAGSSLDPKLSDIRSRHYMNFGSGFVLYAKTIWLGASFMHLNRPDISLLGEDSRLGIRTAVHGGMRLDLSNRLRSGRDVYVTPSFVYQTQGNTFSQLDLGANFHIEPVSVGAWYRGNPLSKGVHGNVQHDALILFMGLYLKHFTVGYSYDFTISGLSTSSGGSHEISLTYAFRDKNIKPKRQRLIPCPAFYNRQGFWD